MRKIDVVTKYIDEVRKYVNEGSRIRVIKWGVDNLNMEWYKEHMSDAEYEEMLKEEGIDKDESEDKLKSSLPPEANTQELEKAVGETLDYLAKSDPNKVRILRSKLDLVREMIPEATKLVYDTDDKVIEFGLRNLPDSWYEDKQISGKGFFGIDFNDLKIKEVEDLPIEEKSYLCEMLEYVELYVYGSKLAPCPRWYPNMNTKLFATLDAVMRADSPAIKFCFGDEPVDTKFLTDALNLYKKIVNDFDSKVVRNAGARLCHFTHVFFEILRASAHISYLLAADYAEAFCERTGKKDADTLLGAYCAYAMESFTNKRLEENYVTTHDDMIKAAVPMILRMRDSGITDLETAVVEFCNSCKSIGFNYEFPDDYHRYGAIEAILPSIQAFVETTAPDIPISKLRTKIRNMTFFTEMDMDKQLVKERVAALSIVLEDGQPFGFDNMYEYLARVAVSNLYIHENDAEIHKFANDLKNLRYSCLLSAENTWGRLLQDLHFGNHCEDNIAMYNMLCDITHNKSFYPLCILYTELRRKKIDVLNLSKETLENLTFVSNEHVEMHLRKLLSFAYNDKLFTTEEVYPLLITLRDSIDVMMMFAHNSKGYDWIEYMNIRRIQTTVNIAVGASEDSKYKPDIIFGDTSTLGSEEKAWADKMGSIVMETLENCKDVVRPEHINSFDIMHINRTNNFNTTDKMVIDVICSFWRNGYMQWLDEFSCIPDSMDSLIKQIEDLRED